MSQHKTLEQMMEEMLAGMDQMQTRLKVIELLVPVPQTVTVQNIADIEGVSFSHINNKGRYLLPRYGVSAFPDGHRRWPLDEYLAWRKVPVEKRIAGYEKHLDEIRLACVERAEARA